MLEDLLDARADKLIYYSPYNFIRAIKPETLLATEQEKIRNWEKSKDAFTLEFSYPTGTAVFYLKSLPWDTDFFKLPTVKLAYCLFDCSFQDLTAACSALRSALKEKGFDYCFIEIPSEDILLIQAL